MTKEDCYELGRLTKTHGIKGELSVYLDVDFPEEYEDLASVLVEIKGELVPYFIEDFKLQHGQKAIVKFEDIDTFDKASQLVGSILYLTLDNLPELEEGQFFYHEIIGSQVVDEHLGVLGKVTDVATAAHQDIILMIYKGKEVLIPSTDAIVKSYEREAHILHVSLPDGLLELYLND